MFDADAAARFDDEDSLPEINGYKFKSDNDFIDPVIAYRLQMKVEDVGKL